VSRALINRLQKLVCRVRGHRLKVISKDILWECQRCGATFLSEDFVKGTVEPQHLVPPSKQESGQPPSATNEGEKRKNGSQP
jgi:hypothetical protein